jgi:hypothetical protein
LLPFALVAALALLTGCGGKGVYPVDGKVVYTDGTVAKDLAGHSVNFESDELQVSATGEVQPDGTFRLGTYEHDDGALPGKYRVSIAPLLPIGDAAPPKAVIDPKYGQLDSSGLEATIEPKSNALTLTVERLSRP